ncbi:MAG: amino acid permease [Spirochaetia bacterium]|nr:amino acid permease [Spirochaetia bacterium]
MEGEIHLSRKLGVWTAVFAVFASMIGSGIFGTSGLVLGLVKSPLVTIYLWIFYGLTALAGALCYAELAAMMPHAGGEYVYIRRIFGELPSFLTGWVSFVVGFAAPAAASAFLAADYLKELFILVLPGSEITTFISGNVGQKGFSILLIVIFSVIHIVGVEKGSFIQNILTGVKLSIISIFIIAGFVSISSGSPVPVSEVLKVGEFDWKGTGLGMLLVLYAYSGWNGASYLAGEIKDPEKNVPRALFWGTLLTMLIYIIMNLLYFLAIPAAELMGKDTPASLTAVHLFGKGVSVLFNIAFCFILLSSISAQIMIGPRVYYAMAKDKNFFHYAGKIHKRFHTPATSIVLQSTLSIVYILTGTFFTVLIYMGFALSIFPIVTMLALIKTRYQNGKNMNTKGLYQTPFFPALPVFFIAVSIYLIVFSFIQNWQSCLTALGAVCMGIPAYYLWQSLRKE